MAKYKYDPELAALGERILCAREAKGWSQDKLAEKMGLERPAISRYENGHSEMGAKTMMKMSAVLETDLCGRVEEAKAAYSVVAEDPNLKELQKLENLLPADDIEMLVQMAKHLGKARGLV